MRLILLFSARMIAAAASAAGISTGKGNATRRTTCGARFDMQASSRRSLMIELLVLFGLSMLFLALLAFVNPCLVGWRTRRGAFVVLAIAVTMLTAGLAAAYL